MHNTTKMNNVLRILEKIRRFFLSNDLSIYFYTFQRIGNKKCKIMSTYRKAK